MKESEEKSKEPKKYYIPVDGKYYETTREIYDVYYQMDRRERYLEERDIKKGVKTFSDISSSAYTADEIIGDCYSSLTLSMPCSRHLPYADRLSCCGHFSERPWRTIA